jgi:branched-chain amino acid transport system substrate-binding protein
MEITRRAAIVGAANGGILAAAPVFSRARAATKSLKIAVCSDFSGPYQAVSGPTGLAAVRLAVQDFGAKNRNFDIEVLQGDHQNKPDVGAALARQWYDQGVDLIIDVPNSAVALSIAGIAGDKNKVFIATSSGTSKLTGSNCNALTLHVSYDTYMLSQSTGGAITAGGGKTWYFVTANYAFGQLLRDQTSDVVKKAGGKVLGDAAYPFPQTTDFSSFLLQAKASGAQVLGLASAGIDTTNQIKQARQFGLMDSMKVAGLLLQIQSIHSLGLQAAQGILATESFYWDLNDRTRAFTKRLLPTSPNNYPNMSQAGDYAATLAFLKSVDAMDFANAKASGAAIVAQMKKMPTDDDAFGTCSFREDGQFMCPSYLFQVKTPAESKMPWDYYKLVKTTSAEDSYQSIATEGCRLFKT